MSCLIQNKASCAVNMFYLLKLNLKMPSDKCSDSKKSHFSIRNAMKYKTASNFNNTKMKVN